MMSPHERDDGRDVNRPGANLLAQETSPYLLQHADNPVHWRPWGKAALRVAKARDLPILLSVGYAACHWCHVMAHESFEDGETAALMNANFVCIKVDREERPDVDQIYMTALHALGEQGGWPLTMFLTPDGEPFWGGTYFPPTARWGRPSFPQVLTGIADAYRSQQDAIRRNVASLKRTLQASAAARPGEAITPDMLDRLGERLLGATDPVEGGLRGAPKFPNPTIFRFLWQNAIRTGRRDGADAVRLLLTKMSRGGIYDHLGGGYARYATDAVWLVPHFEKMLYDNAQILELLALAHAAGPDAIFAARAAETVGWLERDMIAETIDGVAAFAASEDADSEGEEGRFYVWSDAEIDALLGPDAAAFKTAYDVTHAGNWEGKTILRRMTRIGGEAAEASLARSRDILLSARALRVRPSRDDKVLADWNGLAIAALCRAGSVFRRPEWIARAASAFAFIRKQMSGSDRRIAHAWRLGRVSAQGQLDDQAAVARAALALFETTAEPCYLDDAEAIVASAETWFGDGGRGYFSTASDADDLPLADAGRPRSCADNATPSGNGQMAEVLARLYHLTGKPDYRQRADAVLSAFTGLGDGIAVAPTLLASADLLNDATVVVIAGGGGEAAGEPLRVAALSTPDPATCVLSAATTADLPTSHPAFGKAALSGRPAAFICRGGVCGLPISEPAEVTRHIRRSGVA